MIEILGQIQTIEIHRNLSVGIGLGYGLSPRKMYPNKFASTLGCVGWFYIPVKQLPSLGALVFVQSSDFKMEPLFFEQMAMN